MVVIITSGCTSGSSDHRSNGNNSSNPSAGGSAKITSSKSLNQISYSSSRRSVTNSSSSDLNTMRLHLKRSSIGSPSSATNSIDNDNDSSNGSTDSGSLLGLEAGSRSLRNFKSSEEYLYAMKEDLAEWLNHLYSLDINVCNFIRRLETGVLLCRHANNIIKRARELKEASGICLDESSQTGASVSSPSSCQSCPPTKNEKSSLSSLEPLSPLSSLSRVPPDLSFLMTCREISCRKTAGVGTFHARDNVSNFITFCRNLKIRECLLFETEDLVTGKNEKSFILCLLEVARKGSLLGMSVPLLVQMEQEIDREIEADAAKTHDESGYEDEHEEDPESDDNSFIPQVITNDLKSLHEHVVDLLNRCTCPTQYPMIKVADGKYRIGDTKTLIFVRILRSHVMVRVGGGWDTLQHYLDKHDPCRCYHSAAKNSLAGGAGGRRSSTPGSFGIPRRIH